MRETKEGLNRIYIDGTWSHVAGSDAVIVEDPTGRADPIHVSIAGAVEVDRAVAAARRAFIGYAATGVEERIDLLERLLAAYQARTTEMADAICADIAAPRWLSEQLQVPTGIAHISTGIATLRDLALHERRGTTRIEHVPIGVCGLITPWNWPINQIACKVVPALAVGCTVVMKPSELAPRSAAVWAEAIAAAGYPAGVFNMVTGDGSTGALISEHPNVDMISFTGSTRGGIAVAQAAAPTIKRVCQELGGKSANILLDDADFAAAVPAGVRSVMTNSGQTCNAPTRMLVPRARMDEAVAFARATAEAVTVGPPDGNTFAGPVVSRAQWAKIQDLIEAGIAEGARLIAGGPGRPDGLDTGHYVRPTIFADVTNAMRIAREEIFGPVLVIIPYDDEPEAVRIANDSDYGLAGYVQGGTLERSRAVAGQLRAGQVIVNDVGLAALDFAAPFGGFKQSGNGREWGAHGMMDFLEVRAMLGWYVDQAA